MYEIHRDLRQFFQGMRLRAHFTDPDEIPPSQQRSIRDLLSSQNNSQQASGPDLSKYKPKSTWEPHHRSLRSVFRMRSQILPPENLERQDYTEEAEKQLSDTDFYIRQNNDLTESHSVTMKAFLSTMLQNDEIDQQIFDSLNPVEARTSHFYILPKIHTKIVKGRPIISGNGCPTEMISAFVDDHLKDFVKTMPSYVRDTSDFIKKVESFQHNCDYFVFSCQQSSFMDVSSISIPNQEGITVVHRTLSQDHNGQISIPSLKWVSPGFFISLKHVIIPEKTSTYI